MELIRAFADLDKNDASIAGGKGASLGEMTHAGIPVPPGFVLLSSAFERFLQETDLMPEIDAILRTVETREMHTVEHASEKIQSLVLGAKMPEDIAHDIEINFKALNSQFVAVRSSATAEDSASAAWAGQLDSYLNTTEAELLKNVQRCWASLFTPRAIFYRFEKELHLTKISVAVVVQTMVESEFSGIAFSVHPVTEDRNQLIIEAGFGLGEAIVSGQVTPDSYVVEKEPRKIIDINISAQSRALYRAANGGNEWQNIHEPKASTQVLNERQILELSDLIIKIENHYGFPCDIEWAFEAGNFYITQSRPITTLSIVEKKDVSSAHAKLERLGIFNKDLWHEQGRWIQPPLTYTLFFYMHSSALLKKLVPELTPVTMFALDGYAFWKLADAGAITEFFKNKYKDNNLEDLRDRIDQAGEEVFIKLRSLLAQDNDVLRTGIRELFALYKDFTAFWLMVDLMGDRVAQFAKDVSYVASEAELFEKVHPHLRKTWIEREIEVMRTIAQEYLQTKDEAALDQQLQKYIKDFEWMRVVKWAGEPLDLAYARGRLKEEIKNIEEGNYIESKHTDGKPDPIAALSACVAYWRPECGRIEMETALRLQSLFLQLGNEIGFSHEQVLLFGPDELMQAFEQKPSLEKLNDVLRRENGFFSTVTEDGEAIIIDASDPLYHELEKLHISGPAVQTSDMLSGVGASPGHAKGLVRIVNSPKEGGDFKDGEILVAPETTPSFVPLMRKAAAILTGKGGITSHAAIVSRELKKPCVIAIKDVTKILKTGDMVEVDAEKGIVKVIERA